MAEACAALWSLSDTDANREYARGLNLLDLLLEVMYKHRNNAVVSEEAVAAIAVLSRDPQNAKRLIQGTFTLANDGGGGGGGGDVKDHKMGKQESAAISNICSKTITVIDGLVAGIHPDRLIIMPRVVQSSCIAMQTLMLSWLRPEYVHDHHAQEEIQQRVMMAALMITTVRTDTLSCVVDKACGALMVMTNRADDKSIFQQLGGIEVLVGGLRDFISLTSSSSSSSSSRLSPPSLLCLASCVVLTSILTLSWSACNTPATRQYFGATLGGIPILLDCMTMHSRNATVMEPACVLLNVLAMNPDNSVRVGVRGLRILRTCMRIHMKRAVVTQWAAEAFKVLANTQLRILIDQFVPLGILDTLIVALVEHCSNDDAIRRVSSACHAVMLHDPTLANVQYFLANQGYETVKLVSAHIQGKDVLPATRTVVANLVSFLDGHTH